MHAVEGERGIAEDVQPVQALGHAQAALIASIERSLWQQLLHSSLKGGQMIVGALIGGHDGGLAQRLVVEVLANPGQPLIRNEMLDIEIDHLGFEARAILHRGLHAFRERGADQATGKRTTFDLGPVFGHLQRFLRQFKDLPLLVP